MILSTEKKEDGIQSMHLRTSVDLIRFPKTHEEQMNLLGA
jgi:hypothetical protein